MFRSGREQRCKRHSNYCVNNSRPWKVASQRDPSPSSLQSPQSEHLPPPFASALQSIRSTVYLRRYEVALRSRSIFARRSKEERGPKSLAITFCLLNNQAKFFDCKGAGFKSRQHNQLLFVCLFFVLQMEVKHAQYTVYDRRCLQFEEGLKSWRNRLPLFCFFFVFFELHRIYICLWDVLMQGAKKAKNMKLKLEGMEMMETLREADRRRRQRRSDTSHTGGTLVRATQTTMNMINRRIVVQYPVSQ